MWKDTVLPIKVSYT